MSCRNFNEFVMQNEIGRLADGHELLVWRRAFTGKHKVGFVELSYFNKNGKIAIVRHHCMSIRRVLYL